MSLPLLWVALGLLAACGEAAIDDESPAASSDAATPVASFRTATPAPTGPIPSGTPAPSAPAQLTWTREDFPGRVDAVGVDGGRFVAVGRDDIGLAAWTSPDGVAWERHEVPDPSFIDYPPYEAEPDALPHPPEGSSMGSLFRLGDTLFSFGVYWGFNDFYRPIAWRSPDGETWEFVESDSGFFGYGAATDFAVGGDRIVAAHATGLSGAIYSMFRWTATTSWQETDLFSTAEQPIDIADVARAGEHFVAVGATLAPSETPQEQWHRTPAAWRSADGEAWEAIALPIDLVSACAVLSVDRGLIVVGESQDGVVAAWSRMSTDEWERSDIGDTPAPEGCWGYAAGSGDGRFVVVTAASGGPQVWTSGDGIGWARSETDGVVAVHDGIAVLGNIVLVFGSTDGLGSDAETVLLRGVSP